MKKQLPYSIRDSFQTEKTDDFPTIESGDPGLKISVSGIEFVEDKLNFNLNLGYGFHDNVFFAFQEIQQAIVIQLEDPGSGLSAAFPVLDPTVNYIDLPVANFDSKVLEESAVAFLSGGVGIPLRVAVDERGPGLFVRAFLHSWRSNAIHIPLEKGESL